MADIQRDADGRERLDGRGLIERCPAFSGLSPVIRSTSAMVAEVASPEKEGSIYGDRPAACPLLSAWPRLGEDARVDDAPEDFYFLPEGAPLQGP